MTSWPFQSELSGAHNGLLSFAWMRFVPLQTATKRGPWPQTQLLHGSFGGCLLSVSWVSWEVVSWQVFAFAVKP